MKQIPIVLASLLAVPVSCFACATISFDFGDTIQTTDESALIVWNSQTRVEQFVRRANFQTDSKDFGFLVPTPTKPQLSANRDALFDDLESELLPETKTVTRRTVDWSPVLFSLGGSTEEETASAAVNSAASVKSVEVVEQKRVGDYNASVLRASDTASLTSWLRAHRYAVSSDTREWLAPYIKAGFFITAFQIGADSETGQAQAQAVRLSFKTDEPFFPYRETKRAQKVGGGRTLRVFYVGDNRVEGHIESENKTAHWPAKSEYSAPLPADRLRANGLDVPAGQLRLTTFNDQSSPRPGWGDLKFASSKDQGEKTPPPNIVHEDKRVWIPLDLVALASLGCVWMLRRRSLKLQAS